MEGSHILLLPRWRLVEEEVEIHKVKKRDSESFSLATKFCKY